MKPEALDALTTQAMRPKALEAVAAQDNEEKSSEMNPPAQQQVNSLTRISYILHVDARQVHSCQDQDTLSASSKSVSDTSAATTNVTTEALPTAAKIVSEVVQTVKTAVDGAIAWAERKADKLSTEQDTTGPYTSPATCMPSDLDVIASGILPAMPAARQYDGGVDDGKKEIEGTQKSARAGDAEDEKNGEKQDGASEPRL
jgi:hypothetical protein